MDLFWSLQNAELEWCSVVRYCVLRMRYTADVVLLPVYSAEMLLNVLALISFRGPLQQPAK